MLRVQASTGRATTRYLNSFSYPAPTVTTHHNHSALPAVPPSAYSHTRRQLRAPDRNASEVFNALQSNLPPENLSLYFCEPHPRTRILKGPSNRHIDNAPGSISVKISNKTLIMQGVASKQLSLILRYNLTAVNLTRHQIQLSTNPCML